MLENIPVVLNFDYLQDRTLFRPKHLTIFTGPIDEYFNFDLGRLMYRSQQREIQYYQDTDWLLPCGQVNYPDNRPMIRQIEWKHLMPAGFAQRIRGTVVTSEIPWTPDNPDRYEYPFPSEENGRLLEAYQRRLREDRTVLICGRLGEYKYYDMDQAIGRAMTIARKLLQAPRRAAGSSSEQSQKRYSLDVEVPLHTENE
jgi:UDP-galactopyranose mutase